MEIGEITILRKKEKIGDLILLTKNIELENLNYLGLFFKTQS